VERHLQPFVSKEDGGHLSIFAKDFTITDRTKFTPHQAIDCIRLAMATSEALEKGHEYSRRTGCENQL
jgi:hypothetical protein